jgi:hypothetical protein
MLPRGGIVYTYDKASRRATMKVGSLSTSPNGGAEVMSPTVGRGPCWNVFERWAGFSKEVYLEWLA